MLNRGSSARKKAQHEIEADKLLEEVSVLDEGEQSRKAIL